MPTFHESHSRRITILLVLLATAALLSVRSQGHDDESTPVAEACRDSTGVPCAPPRDSVAPADSAAADLGEVLPAEGTCHDVGYLCAEVEEKGNLQIARYSKDTEYLTVLVPPPPHESSYWAAELQRAAMRGVEAWQGHPFPLLVLAEDKGEAFDLQVGWAPVLQGSALGETRGELRREGAAVSYRVVSMILGTRSPFNPDQPLSPRQVELTAAHEMGHALGLPHSDNSLDLMYPKNTARYLTPRDFQTLDALYALPNGAQVRR